MPGFKVNEAIADSDVLFENVHQILAMILNLIIVFSAPHSFQFFKDQNLWVIYYLVSIMGTYKYLSNSKDYDLINFEEVY